MRIDDLTNEQLLSALRRVLGDERSAVAAMLAYLIEVEKRRLHLEQACSSMHDFCARKLGLSEDQASRRIAAARLGARFPELVEAIGDGRMHLSGVLQLRGLFTEANVAARARDRCAVGPFHQRCLRPRRHRRVRSSCRSRSSVSRSCSRLRWSCATSSSWRVRSCGM
ncbi:MAG: hypothetical protein KIT84_37760 [Labilithrix sp.]|nr:hypothetical protein [Labilithrix sp.]MCW5816804.1 hypothetical protein [Labilithrix sp.]